MSYKPHPTKHGHWYIIIETRTGGKREQKYIKFKGSEVEAAAVDAEMNNKPVDVQYPSILDILPRFLAAYQNNTQPNSYSAMQQSLKHLLPYYGEMRIPLISNHHHEEYKSIRLASNYLPGRHGQHPNQDTPEQTERRKQPSKNSINRELNALNALLTYAEGEKIVVSCRPALFEKKHCTKKAIIPLAPSQLVAMVNALHGPQATPIRLMLYAGLRLQEATQMKCEDIHLDNRTMYVTGKGGSIQLVPIPAPLFVHLTQTKGDRETGWLSVNPTTKQPYGDITKRLNTFCKQAGIKKEITHHTLRHSCATALILAGVELPRVQAILRHESIETTMLYVHIAASFGDSKEGLIARALFGLDSGKDTTTNAGVTSVVALSLKGPVRADAQKKVDNS
jgi:integrase/recombinase XerD